MSNISTFSTVAGNNNSSPPNGWPEGMARSAVNDTARELYSALAKWYGDTKGTLLSAGTSTAYTLTTNNVHATLGAQAIVSFRAHVASGASPTLNVDSLGAKAIHKRAGSAVAANDIPINSIVVVQYNPNLDRYEMLSGAPLSASEVTSTELATNAVTTAKITDANVTTAKIAPLNITTALIADSNVTTAKIADGNVTAVKLGTDSVTTIKILDANVTAAKLATDAVTNTKIQTDAVTTVKILDANVTNAKLATDSVSAIKIQADAVTTAKILNDNVTYAKIQNVSATDRLLGRDTAAAGDIEELSVTSPLAFTGGPGLAIQTATDRLVGRDTAGTGNVEEIPVTAPLAFTGGPGLTVSTATTAATGAVELATDAETVTGTDTARVAPLSSMVRHEGVAKAWASVTLTAGGASLDDSYNVTSVSRTSQGLVAVTLAVTMTNALYAVQATNMHTANASYSTRVHTRTTTTFNVEIEEGGANRDDNFSFVVYGTLA